MIEEKDNLSDRLNMVFGTPNEEKPEEKNETSFFDQLTLKVSSISGVNYTYILNNQLEVVKEFNTTNSQKHLESVQNILKSQELLNNISKLNYKEPFHTLTLLNETGLIIITKLNNSLNNPFYIVVIAGEDKPVDLINLLKICKETRENLLSQSI